MIQGRRFNLRGTGDEIEVHRRGLDAHGRVTIELADLQSWLSDESGSPREVLGLYEDVTGARPHLPMTQADIDHVISVLARAFEMGALVASKKSLLSLGVVSNALAAPPKAPPTPPPAAKQPRTLIRKTWMSIQLVDDQKKPVPGAAYEIVDGSKVIARGTLDEHGSAYVDGVKDGTYSVRFPEIDGSEWS